VGWHPAPPTVPTQSPHSPHTAPTHHCPSCTAYSPHTAPTHHGPSLNCTPSRSFKSMCSRAAHVPMCGLPALGLLQGKDHWMVNSQWPHPLPGHSCHHSLALLGGQGLQGRHGRLSLLWRDRRAVKVQQRPEELEDKGSVAAGDTVVVPLPRIVCTIQCRAQAPTMSQSLQQQSVNPTSCMGCLWYPGQSADNLAWYVLDNRRRTTGSWLSADTTKGSSSRVSPRPSRFTSVIPFAWMSRVCHDGVGAHFQAHTTRQQTRRHTPWM
jgi:hypothetical protein